MSNLIPIKVAEQAMAVRDDEIARLKALTVEMDKTINISQTGCRELKAEVERLRASSFVTAVPSHQYERVVMAGDAMAKRTEFFQKRWDSDELCQEVEVWNAAKNGWNAAKEGKQP